MQMNRMNERQIVRPPINLILSNEIRTVAGVVSNIDTNPALVVLWITSTVHSYAIAILDSPEIQIKGEIGYLHLEKF